ncbi:hypothetical protein QF000_003590 [Paraburkholderia atlantica]|uniref:Uncharacterized protein n=1 Tax=Paraburkholderia atlantica TaxID=2654982 RepID=A0A6I1PTN7_PARAM|nr:hypothetical protein [Paraburkholderia atlantica]MBB5417802.1 hypothetical protein [Paraburkholderia atlantica]MBB5422196.1 hypothetical protein [Paraburkholderia atlantica]MPW05338.1 hypothetical protein [Paraburkholderia atlantica]NUY30853.1 hypothetical protein [Paraburkholderia atlantica]
MATETGRHFDAIAMTVRHLGAIPSKRLLKIALGWSITLWGMSILMNDARAAIAPFLHGVAGAIMKTIA